MTCILRNVKTKTYHYFDDVDELYQWIDEFLIDRTNWEMIDEEGQCFYI
jgi:hypothetical protein